MPRSSRANTASQASLVPAKPPNASLTASGSALTAMPAKSPCSGDGATVKKVVPFKKASEKSLFGSKAVGLGDAARQQLAVPPGVALSGDLVEAIASGEDRAIEKLAKAIAGLTPPFAVRSSA